MENDKTKWVWGLVAVVVVIGLIMIWNKNSSSDNSETVAKEEKTSAPLETVKPQTKTKTTSPAKTTGSQTVAPGVTSPKKTGNIVELTSKGFVPASIEIKQGESVEFVNSSDMAMVIKGQGDIPENNYPGFSQESGPLGKGGKFFFAFTRVGYWPYVNQNSGLNTPKYQGVIIVK